MFGEFAYWIVENNGMWQNAMDPEGCVNFLNTSMTLALAVMAFSYLLYRFALWRFWRMEGAQSVGTLRGPWVTGLLIGFFIQFVAATVLGFVQISQEDFPIAIAILLTALLEGLAVILVYWLLSWISSPLRCWLAPPGRRLILRIFGIAK